MNTRQRINEKRLILNRNFILTIAEYLKQDKNKDFISCNIYKHEKVKGIYNIAELSLNLNSDEYRKLFDIHKEVIEKTLIDDKCSCEKINKYESWVCPYCIKKAEKNNEV